MGGSVWSDPGPDKGYSWVVCVACFWVNFFAGGFRNCQGNLFVLIQRGHGVTREAASWPNTWLSLTASLSALFSGVMNHYFGWRTVLNVLSIVGTVGFFGAFFSPSSVLWISFYQAIIGLAMGPVFPTLVKASSSFFVERRSTAQNIFAAGNPLSSIVFPVLLDLAAEHFGLRGSWLIMGSLYIQSFVFITLMRPRTKRQFRFAAEDGDLGSSARLLKSPACEGQNGKLQCPKVIDYHREIKLQQESVSAAGYIKQIKELMQDIRFHIFLLVTTVDFSVLMVVFFVIIDHGTDSGLSVSNATMLVVVISIGDCLGRLVAGYLIDRKFLSLAKSYAVASVCQSLVYLIIGFTSSVEILFVACFLSGVVTCFTSGIRTLMTTNLFGLNKAATITGLMMCLLGCFVALSPLFIGYFREGFGSYGYMFLLFSGISATIAALMFCLDFCVVNKDSAVAVSMSEDLAKTLEVQKKPVVIKA